MMSHNVETQEEERKFRGGGHDPNRALGEPERTHPKGEAFEKPVKGILSPESRKGAKRTCRPRGGKPVRSGKKRKEKASILREGPSGKESR